MTINNLYRLLFFLWISFSLFTGCQGEEERMFPLTEFSDESVIPIEEEKESEVSASEIYVDVSGQVNQPGIFCLPEGSRVFQAIEMAGGLTSDAEVDQLNQAQILCDGQKIYIPSKEEIIKKEEEITDAGDGKININTAGVEELMTLSGIGKAKAEAIVRYREEKGRFSSIDEIQNVEGIKDGTFQKLKDQITV